MKKWKVVIESKTSPFRIPWEEIWQYRDLCWTFIRKNFITRYKQTIFGPFYMILVPLVTSGLFTLIFGKVVGVSTDGAPQFLFYMIGNIIWGIFVSSFEKNAAVFATNAYIMGKVYFPRLIIPFSNVLTQWIDTFVQYLLFLFLYVMFVIWGDELQISIWILFVPFWLVLASLLGLGLALIVTSLTVKYRDLKVFTGFVIKLLMYVSPILYPISSIGKGWMRDIALLNPLASMIEVVRSAFFGSGYISFPYLSYSVFISLVIIFTGIVLFNITEKTFIDLV